MRSKEPQAEDRKLLAVKSWFTRSLSSLSSQNAAMVLALSDGDSPAVSVAREGGIERGPGLAPLKQLSMRRSRPSGEIDREPGITGSPSMTPRNITPLTPLTPLRWKSNPREQEEEERVMERSRLGSSVTNGVDSGREEEQEHAHDRRAQVSPTAQAENVDEVVSPHGLHPEDLDRKPSSGDDVMTMTIEFLRARLLSERSASKAAKSRVQDLAAKVAELEQRLDQAIEDRKKAELAAQEALTKLKLAESSNQVTERTSGEVLDRSISNSTKGSPLSRSRNGREDTKYLQQEMSSNDDLSRTNSYGSSVEDRDTSTKKPLPETVSKLGLSGARSSLQNISERNQDSPQKQGGRDAIESRLRNMWTKISEEMTALAEERSEEDAVREELMSWMGQVPTVLQDIIPNKLVNLSRDVHLKAETDSPMADSPAGPPPHHLQAGNGQLQAKSKRTALLHEQFAAQESVQEEWERNYQESQRMLEQLKGNDHRNGDRSPNGHHHGDGLNGVADGASFLGSHRARISKSKSALDLPAKPNGYSSEITSPYRDGSHAELDSWNRERPRRQGSDNRHHDLVNQSTPAHGHMPQEHTHLNHNQFRQDRSAVPSTLQESGREAWSERQLDQEAGGYYQDTDNRSGYVEGGFSDRSQWPSNRSAEDGFRTSQPDFRAGQPPTWDDGDRRNSGRQYGDDSGRLERDNYYRDSEREESYNSSQPESTPKHRHRRSHSDNSDWPAADEYGLQNQMPEPSLGLGRRQESYHGFPSAIAPDLSRRSFDRATGSNGDERLYGARGPTRQSYPASKSDHVSGPPYAAQPGRNGYSNAPEPTLALGYGPTYDAPGDGSPVRQPPNAGLNKNINDVLRALQMAKANIQNGGTGAKEPRLSGEQKPGFGMEPSAQQQQQQPAPRQQPAPEHFRYFENQPAPKGASRPVSHNARYDRYEAEYGRDQQRYQAEGDAMAGPNTNNSYVDQLNVGKGIQFFFPQ